MTIKVKSNSCNTEFIINDEATIHEYIDAIFNALIIDGFHKDTIVKGFESKVLELKEDNYGQEET